MGDNITSTSSSSAYQVPPDQTTSQEVRMKVSQKISQHDTLGDANTGSAKLGFGDVGKVSLPSPQRADLSPSDYHQAGKVIERVESQQSLGLLGSATGMSPDKDPLTNMLHAANQANAALQSWKTSPPSHIPPEVISALQDSFDEALETLGVTSVEDLGEKTANGSIVPTIKALNAKTGGGYGPSEHQDIETASTQGGKTPSFQMPQMTGVFQAITVLNNVTNIQSSTIVALQSVLNQIQSLLVTTSNHLTDLQAQITQEQSQLINGGWEKALGDVLKLAVAATVGFMIGGPAGAAIMVASSLVMFAVNKTNLFGAGGPIDNMLSDMGVPEKARSAIETGLSIGFSITVAVVSASGMKAAKMVGKEAVEKVGAKVVTDVVADVGKGVAGDVEGGIGDVRNVADRGGGDVRRGLAEGALDVGDTVAGQVREVNALEQFSQILKKAAEGIVKAIKFAATPVSYLWDTIKTNPNAAFAMAQLCQGLVASGAAYNLTDFVALESGMSSKDADQLAKNVAMGVNIALTLSSGILMLGSAKGSGNAAAAFKGHGGMNLVKMATTGLQLTQLGSKALVDTWNAIITFELAGPMKQMQHVSTDTDIIQTWFNQVQAAIKQQNSTLQQVMGSITAMTRSVAPAGILG